MSTQEPIELPVLPTASAERKAASTSATVKSDPAPTIAKLTAEQAQDDPPNEFEAALEEKPKHTSAELSQYQVNTGAPTATWIRCEVVEPNVCV